MISVHIDADNWFGDDHPDDYDDDDDDDDTPHICHRQLLYKLFQPNLISVKMKMTNKRYE